MNEDELILRRKKQSADRARAYRKRKKDPDAMPSTSTVQSGEPVFENNITIKLLHRKHLNAERCRRYRQKSKRLKSGAIFNRGTCDSNTSAIPKIEESCRKCETPKNQLSVRRPVKTYTERARAFRAQKEALKNAARQELNISSPIISNTKPKTPAESSDLTRITVGVHQEQENSQPSTSTLPMKKIKTSTEHSPEIGVGEKSLINLTEDIIEDFQTSSNTVNANNNNNNTGNNIKLIFVRRPAKTSTQGVRKHRAQKKALKNPDSQELNVSSSITSNTDEVIETNNDGKLIMKDGTPDVCRACHKPGESVRHISGCSHLANDLDSGYKIFDDIDIEQHDVLDNPRIKNIFPDITCIKTDVMKYEDEDINDFDEESYETYQQDLTDPEIQECSFVLEDCGDSLKYNPCFCSNCEILFPTENALSSHKMTAHSFRAAIGRNKAIKSTSKSSIVARLKFKTDSNMEISNLCNHCNEVFPDEKSFLKHSDELLTRKFICNDCDIEFESEISLQQHLRTHSTLLLYCCPICSCYFKSWTKILKHMINQHQVDMKEEPKAEKATYKCRFCPKILKDKENYNDHIRIIHPELYTNIVKDKTHTDQFKSQSCNLTFPSKSCLGSKAEILKLATDLNMELSNLYNDCNQVFPDEKSRREFSCNDCDLEFESEISLKQHSRTHPSVLMYCCPICCCYFQFMTKIVSHMFDQHQIDVKKEPKAEKVGIYKCRFCAKIFKDNKYYNVHIQNIHRDLHNKKSTKFEYQPCNLTFLSAHSEKIHRVSQHAIEAETSSKSVDLDKQIKIEPLSPTITHRVSQHEIDAETSSKSVDLDKQIKIEPLSPTISHRVSQHEIDAETSSKSVYQDKQIKMEPLSPTISHRVSQHEIDAETSSKSVDQDKQIKMEPLSPTISHRISQHEIDAETSSKSVDQDKQIKMEPLSPTITHRVSQHEIDAETSSKSVDQDEQIKIEPLSPTISHRVSQHAIEAETSSKSVYQDKQIKIEPLSPTITDRVSQPVIKTYSRSVNLDKQIKIEPLSPSISHRVSQHQIKTYSKSVDLHKQIKIEPLSPKITQTDLKQELQ